MSVPAEDTRPLREIILENQRIIDELNAGLSRKTSEVRIIQEISQAVTGTLDLDQILGNILDAMDRVLGFQHSMILLLDDGGETLRTVASRGYAESGVGATVAVGVGVIGVVARKRKMMRIGNLGAGLAYTGAVRAGMTQAGGGAGLGEAAKLPGLPKAQSQIAIPLLIRDTLVGVFAVESERPAAFDELDATLISILAHQAASAIHQARVHKRETERVEALARAQAELKRFNESLEERVQARTAELGRAHAEMTAALEQVREEKARSQELLGRMAPPEVVPLMMEDQLLARKLKATILFTDLEGFTKFSSGIEPDELFAKLNHFFSRAGLSVQKYRGYVNKTNGDSIMALFGVPYENHTHALDAVLAGLDMQREILVHFALRMRIGVNTGVLTAGILGPTNKSLYDVLGDAVNVASRMEKLCPPGSIAVAEDTFRLIEPYFETRALGEQEVKGKGKMAAYEVVRVRPLAEDRRRVDGSSAFVREHVGAIRDVEEARDARFPMVDFRSIQARDGAVLHNEAVAAMALALHRRLLADPGVPAALKDVVAKEPEEDLVALALLHDLGKHALEPARLNDPNLTLAELDRLRADLLRHTKEGLAKLDLAKLVHPLEQLYAAESSKRIPPHVPPLAWIIAAADIYDALTAPKLYKGRGWTVTGSLEELLRMAHGEEPRRVFNVFVDLMRPESARIADVSSSTVLFR